MFVCLVLGIAKKSEARVPRFQQRTLPHPGEGVLSVPPCVSFNEKIRVTKHNRLSFVFSFLYFCRSFRHSIFPGCEVRALQCINEPHRWV